MISDPNPDTVEDPAKKLEAQDLVNNQGFVNDIVDEMLENFSMLGL